MSARVDRASATLARDGYCVIVRPADPALIAGINEGLAPCFAAPPLCAGHFYVPRTQRFGALLMRSHAMAPPVMPDPFLAMVQAALLLWSHPLALTLPQASAHTHSTPPPL